MRHSLFHINKRTEFFFVALIASLTISSNIYFYTPELYAQSGEFASYTNRRINNDINSLTCRKSFDTMMQEHFIKKLEDLCKETCSKVSNLKLNLDMRLISQNCRGEESAHAELPLIINYLLDLIELAQDSTSFYENYVLKYSEKTMLVNKDKESVISNINQFAQSKAIKLSYWGYLKRTKIYPVLDKQKLYYYARWHEGESFYETANYEHVVLDIIKMLLKD